MWANTTPLFCEAKVKSGSLIVMSASFIGDVLATTNGLESVNCSKLSTQLCSFWLPAFPPRFRFRFVAYTLSFSRLTSQLLNLQNLAIAEI
jgi:hypothetical protein